MEFGELLVSRIRENETVKRFVAMTGTPFKWIKKNSRSILFWLNFLAIFIPPFVLATPFPLYVGIYQIKIVPASIDTINTEIGIPDKVQSLGVPFFSKLSGIEVYSLKTEICLWNRNEVYVDNKRMSKSDLIDGDEAGAMEITMQYANGTTSPVYSPRHAIRCLPLRDNSGTSIILKNDLIFRNPNPFGQPQIVGDQLRIPVYPTTVDSSKTIIFALPDLFSRGYLLNLMIFSIAWTLIYIHVVNVIIWIRKTWKWKQDDEA